MGNFARMVVNSPEYKVAIEDVKNRVAASRSSFTAGMAILPKERREAMFALYAFCREVDDIADDGATLETRKRDLQKWRERINLLFTRGTICESITTALLPAIGKFGLVEEDFQAIIDGMEMDAGDPICAPSMELLDLYCDRVASAVGRVSVRIFGDGSKSGMQVAYHLGHALQLTNILRDLAEDADRERLYLPEELLSKHNVCSRNPKEVSVDKNLKLVGRDLACIAMHHFEAAEEAMSECIPKTMRPANIMKCYYKAILQQLLKNDWNQPLTRVSLSKIQKMWLLLKGMLG